MKKTDWLVLLFIIISSVFTLKDLFKPGFYTSHDGIHQVVRLFYFDQSIRDGQIPPRWAGGLLNGFGYPLFIFSYHMPWIIAEPFYLSGLSIFDSIKMTFLVGFIISGITMYFFQRSLFGRLAAVVGTIIYLFAPFRFSNIFVRAAIGDSTVFIFPPLIFLSLWKLKQSTQIDWRWITLGAISLTGLFLSHAMVFIFFFLSNFVYIIFSLIFLDKKRNFIISSSILIVLSIGLSGYYFIPSLTEKNLTNFSQLIKSVYYGATFLNFKQLLYSPWGYGTVDAKEGAMSLQFGIAQWLAFIFSVVVSISLFIKSKFRLNKDLQEILIYFLLFILTIYLMLSPSKPVWNILGNVMQIDFVWRILSVSIFAVSVLTGFLLKNTRFPLIIAFLLIFIAFYSNRNHLQRNQTLDWPLNFYLLLEKTTNSFDEYTPKWVQKELIKDSKPKVEFFDSYNEIKIIKNKSNILEFQIVASASGKVRINTIYYPGWNVMVNGNPMTINYQGSGLIEFPIQSGKSKIVARFSETPQRAFSNLLTVVSFGFILYVLIKYREV